MLSVVDANTLFSAPISRSTTFDLMCLEKLRLAAPEFLLVELDDHRAEVLRKSSLSEEVFEEFLDMLMERIETIPSEEFKDSLSKAKSLSPDPDDVQYFALALKLNCPIWSMDEEPGEKQSRVKVLSTRELIKLLKS